MSALVERGRSFLLLEQVIQGSSLAFHIEGEALVRDAQQQRAARRQQTVPAFERGERKGKVFENVAGNDEIKRAGLEGKMGGIRNNIWLHERGTDLGIVAR